MQLFRLLADVKIALGELHGKRNSITLFVHEELVTHLFAQAFTDE
jgi:hypothetical protein